MNEATEQAIKIVLAHAMIEYAAVHNDTTAEELKQYITEFENQLRGKLNA